MLVTATKEHVADGIFDGNPIKNQIGRVEIVNFRYLTEGVGQSNPQSCYEGRKLQSDCFHACCSRFCRYLAIRLPHLTLLQKRA